MMLPNPRFALAIGLLAVLGLLPGCSNPAAETPAAVVGPAVPESAGAPTVEAASADAPAAATEAAGGLSFSGEGSTIGFVGSKLVGGSHDGGFKTFHGAFTLDEATGQVAGVETTIDTTSIWSDNDKLTNHLKSKDFFEVDTYPEAQFVSTEIKPAADTSKGATHDVTGNLTLHGVTKSITFPATIAVTDSEVALDSTFDLKRGDFGIVYGNAGDNIIRDEVVLKLAVKAPRAAPAE